MAFSTDTAIQAWRFEDINPSLLCQVRRLAPAEATRELARLRTLHGDAAWLARLLDDLPAPSLCILALLAGGGGFVEEYKLFDSAHQAFRLSDQEATIGISALLAQLLVVPLAIPGHGSAFSLVATCADAVVAKVSNLDAPTLGKGAFVPAATPHGARSVLAVSAGLRHVDLKCSVNGAPNKGGIKRIAKQLGLTEHALEELVYRSQDLGLVVVDEQDTFRPDVENLVAAATGTYAHAPVLALLRKDLRAHGRPVAEVLVGRWLAHCGKRYREAIASRGAYRTQDAHVVGMLDLAFAPGVEVGAVGEHKTVRYVDDPGRAAGTITPSFEVFIPPEARWIDVVHLLGAAELVRVDQVIVARLTKTAMMRALRAGASIDALIGQIASACRTPVPQNVEATLRDWAAGSLQAVVAFGRTIVVPASETDRARAALSKLAPRVLAPGVLLVDAQTQPRAIETALTSIGILISETPNPPTTLRPARVAAPTAMYPPMQIAPGDTRYLQRIAAYQRGDAAERGKLGGLAPPGDDDDDYGDDDGGDHLESVGAEMVEAIQRVLTKLKAWEHKLRVRVPDEHVMGIASLLVEANDLDQQFVFSAKSLAEFRARIAVLESRDAVAAPRRTDIEWHREHVQARLEAAAKVGARMFVDVDGETMELAISKVIKRGSTWMLLAEDDLEPVALPLRAIRAVAEPPPDRPATQPWQALPGQDAPPGHAPCPCGSGRKYRACCRAN